MTRDAMENVVLAGLREHFEGDIVPLAILDEISKHDEAQREDIAKLRDTRDQLATQLNEYVQENDKLQADLDRVKAERDECDRILTVNYGHGYRDYDAYWKPTTELGKMCALTVKQLAGSLESARVGAGILLKKNTQLHADLDQVMGEAIRFAMACCEHYRLAEEAKQFLTSHLGQAYGVRQLR